MFLMYIYVVTYTSYFKVAFCYMNILWFFSLYLCQWINGTVFSFWLLKQLLFVYVDLLYLHFSFS